MARKRNELWPWESILYWLRIGVLGGLIIGAVAALSLVTLAARYRPPVTHTEQLEQMFKTAPRESLPRRGR